PIGCGPGTFEQLPVAALLLSWLSMGLQTAPVLAHKPFDARLQGFAAAGRGTHKRLETATASEAHLILAVGRMERRLAARGSSTAIDASVGSSNPAFCSVAEGIRMRRLPVRPACQAPAE